MWPNIIKSTILPYYKLVINVINTCRSINTHAAHIFAIPLYAL